MDHRLHDVATARGGVFAARHATAVGVPWRELSRLVARGEVRRIRTDAYVLAPVWDAATDDERMVLGTRAVLLSLGRGYAAGSVSALALRGLPVWGVDRTVVHVGGPVQRGRTRAGVRFDPLEAGTTEQVNGWPAIRTPVAIVDVACRVGVVAAVIAADAALHRGVVSRKQLEATIATRPERWARRLARLMELVDPASESVGESRLRILMVGLGFRPRSQVEIRDEDGGLIGRVDFLVGERVVVEFDGLVKYESAEGRAALAREKAREERLTEAGYVVVRFVWADLDHPQRVMMRLARAVARVRAA